jgi:hypothetical protein
MNIAGVWYSDPLRIAGGFDCERPGLGLMLTRYARVFQDARHLLVIEGEAFDIDVENALTDPTRLHHAYGLFTYVWFDNQRRKTVIGTDRLGYSPLYYAEDGQSVLFSTSLTYLKSAIPVRTPDYAAWEELSVLGELLGNKTTVREIRRADYGTTLELVDGRISVRRHWEPDVPALVDYASYIRRNNELLDEAMSFLTRQTRPQVVALSGGEDSRRIADAAVRCGLPVSFWTQQAIQKGDIDKDTELAREVAGLLRRPFHGIPMPSEEQFFGDIEERDSLLGFESLAHEWMFELRRHLPSDSLVYDGIIGDVSINGHYFKAFPMAVKGFRDIRALARAICGPYEEKWWLEEIRRRAGSRLVDRVQAALERCPDSAHRLTYYFLLNHTRRRIALAAQIFNQHGHWTCYPYSYAPLLLQSLSLDPAVAAEKFMQRECLAAISPQTVAIPTTRGEVPPRFVRDMGNVNARRETYMRKRLTISREALDVFPDLRRRARVTSILQLPGFAYPLRRYGWFIEHVSRFSQFLRWLKSVDVPSGLRPIPASSAHVREAGGALAIPDTRAR